MAERWDRERVLALAPDAPSQRTAPSLASGRAWPATGAAAGAARCGVNAGAAPPRRTAPWSTCPGPAYRCSCPSRKFPCKHVLALLLLWSEGSVPDDAAGPPDWAACLAHAPGRQGEPRASRRVRPSPRTPRRLLAAPSSARPGSRPAWPSSTGGSATRCGRAWPPASRPATATGTTSPPGWSTRKPPAWPSVSAPSPRSRIRARAGTAGSSRSTRCSTCSPSPTAGQAELPPPLRDTVRSRIGFSLRQADVLAGGQPVRDHWQVLARRDLEQDRIRTRRTWLRGRKTGRDALLLSFAAAGQSLDDSLAVGTDADADLVFYPGAVPLRAVVLARHDTADGGPPDGGTVAGLLAGYAAALGRRPLAGQLARRAGDHPGPRPAPVPVRTRTAAPAAAPGRRRLLAAVRALRRPPGDAGRRVDAARPVAADRLGRGRTGGTAVSDWQDLVTASLIGTERAPVPAPAVPGLPPVRAGRRISRLIPAAQLLDRAALLTVARRGGRPAGPGRAAARGRTRPGTRGQPGGRPPAGPDARRRAPGPAGRVADRGGGP